MCYNYKDSTRRKYGLKWIKQRTKRSGYAYRWTNVSFVWWQVPERRRMENSFIYTPKINHEVKEVITIADLIPEGRENAISRAMLTAKCVKNGLIDNKAKDKDRAMRNLVKKARIDWTILNLSDGDGYYRPTHEDLLELRRYIRQEEMRGISVFKNIHNAKKLYEDLKAGRLNE